MSIKEDLQRKLIRSKKQNRREGKREVKRGRGRGGCQGENSNFHEKERSEKGGREQHGVYTNYTMHQGIHQGVQQKTKSVSGTNLMDTLGQLQPNSTGPTHQHQRRGEKELELPQQRHFIIVGTPFFFFFFFWG